MGVHTSPPNHRLFGLELGSRGEKGDGRAFSLDGAMGMAELGYRTKSKNRNPNKEGNRKRRDTSPTALQ